MQWYYNEDDYNVLIMHKKIIIFSLTSWIGGNLQQIVSLLHYYESNIKGWQQMLRRRWIILSEMFLLCRTARPEFWQRCPQPRRKWRWQSPHWWRHSPETRIQCKIYQVQWNQMSNKEYLVKYKIQKPNKINVFVYKINNVICIRFEYT